MTEFSKRLLVALIHLLLLLTVQNLTVDNLAISFNFSLHDGHGRCLLSLHFINLFYGLIVQKVEFSPNLNACCMGDVARCRLSFLFLLLIRLLRLSEDK